MITAQSRLRSNHTLPVHVCAALLTTVWHCGEILTQEPSTTPRRANTEQIRNDCRLVSLPTWFVLVTTAMAETFLLSVCPGAGGLATISLCPVIAWGERATRQHNMSVNNRLAAQWRHYRSRDVWLSWDPSLPRGRKNTSPLCNLISQCLARFGCLVPGEIVKQRETFTVSDRSRYSAEGGGLNCQVVYCISWSNVWQEHLQWNI